MVCTSRSATGRFTWVWDEEQSDDAVAKPEADKLRQGNSLGFEHQERRNVRDLEGCATDYVKRCRNCVFCASIDRTRERAFRCEVSKRQTRA